jgi:hypothetical protein
LAAQERRRRWIWAGAAPSRAAARARRRRRRRRRARRAAAAGGSAGRRREAAPGGGGGGAGALRPGEPELAEERGESDERVGGGVGGGGGAGARGGGAAPQPRLGARRGRHCARVRALARCRLAAQGDRCGEARSLRKLTRKKKKNAIQSAPSALIIRDANLNSDCSSEVAFHKEKGSVGIDLGQRSGEQKGPSTTPGARVDARATQSLARG